MLRRSVVGLAVLAMAAVPASPAATQGARVGTFVALTYNVAGLTEPIVQLAHFIQEHSEGRAVILDGDTNLKPEKQEPERAEADSAVWRWFQVTFRWRSMPAPPCPSGCPAP